MAGHLTLAYSSDAPRATRRIRVVLAEAHESMRRTLRSLLDSEPTVEVAADVGSLRDCHRAVIVHHPDVLLLDLRMPDGLSIASIGDLREEAPATAIVVLTMHESTLVAKRVLDAGASGLVLKDTADTELVEAVARAAHGEMFSSPRLTPGYATS